MTTRMFWLLGVVAAIEPVQFETSIKPHNPAHSSWVQHARADADRVLQLNVAIRVDTHRLSELERVFFEVSDPDHANYGQHLTVDEVTELLTVPEDRTTRVRDFFLNSGATSAEMHPNRDSITVQMPVSAVEATLDTEIHEFRHSEQTGVSVWRASRHYSLPKNIAEDVVMVGELLQFPRLRSRTPPNLQVSELKSALKNECNVDTCDGKVTPSVLAARYKLPEPTETDKKADMAIGEFQGQGYDKEVVEAFGKACNVPGMADIKVDGDLSGVADGIECELDIQYIKAVNPNAPLTLKYNDEYSVLDYFKEITAKEDTPKIHSMSYGNDENQQSSTQYILTANTAFQKVGARGISIIFASGDQGVCGREGCDSPLPGYPDTNFKPDFPGDSPYITVVGGTDFLGDDIGDEQAWSSSGGGFSNVFPIPDYQKDAVAAYKARKDANLPPQAMWNNTGRGYPDIAALGGEKNPYCINTGDGWTGVSGTSASAPVVAGIFARLNALRIDAGKPVMGFLNPFIYKNPTVFNDVKHGLNDFGSGNGFTATAGWDAATGFGTPDFEALSKAVMAATTKEILV